MTDTLGLTWNDLDTVCSTGTCTADIGAVDLTGWTWASADDVRSLFNEFIFAATGTNPLGDIYSELFNSTWATSFTSFFTNTSGSPLVGFVSVEGVTISEAPSNPSQLAIVGILSDSLLFEAGTDTALFSAFPKSRPPFPSGAWLYQPSDSTSLPEPASLLLVCAGLAAVAVRRHRPRP